MMRCLRKVVLMAMTLVVAVPGIAAAQLSPDVEWRTLRTEHFQVHFSPGLEEHARRAAVNAERAYTQLSAELVPPRGPLDLVIADNVDFTNGYATAFPTNRIVIYAHPPIAASSLRFYDEWSALVITHELTHIFHLDRARGWWRFAQRIFGRSPPIMPNYYTPSWLNEGLAVYYESRLTGSGRLIGTEHGMIARAAAIAGTGRRLDELSLATSQYPGGQSAYAYGSLLFDHLARTRGPEGVGRFVERISAAPLPFFLNRAARRSFGVSLEDAWRQFQDSLRREVRAPGPPMTDWRELTSAGRDVQHPRWLNDTTLIYSANTGRQTPGAYTVDLAGRTRRLGRRTGLEPNMQLADGSILFAQLEYLDPYRVRSDLWVERRGRQYRLTRDKRLASPDVRRVDSAIVAVQATPGTTRLVLVSLAEGTITALTTTSPDTQWSEPRWSPDGRRIAAVRRSRDGYSEVVVLQEGTETIVLTRSRSVEASPAWSADGGTIFFASDRTGSPQIYTVEVDAVGSARIPVRVSEAATGIVEPEPAPGRNILASVLFRADGYHLGVSPLGRLRLVPAPIPDSAALVRAPLAPLTLDTSTARKYSPWRTFLPRYWLPTIESLGDGNTAYGGLTSGGDVIGRHSYAAGAQITPSTGDIAGGVGYDYSGFGNPVLGASFSQYSDYDAVRLQGDTLGYFRERTQVLGVSATLMRPRYRSSSSVTLAGELERSEFSTRPAVLIDQLAGVPSADEFAAAVLSAGVSNTQRPALSISPEDGVALSGLVRRRWRRSDGDGSTILFGSTRAYRSLPLPGFAHHVLAARVSGAWASDSTTDFDIGGTSGSSIEIVPGYSVGDSPRSFGVRGFPLGVQSGRRALGGTLEYRAPLLIPARGYRLLPLFFDKVSFSAFGDAAAAWCPEGADSELGCRGVTSKPEWIASVGGEINLDAALPYDVPYRFRLGVASPIRRAGLSDIDDFTVYFTLGYSF